MHQQRASNRKIPFFLQGLERFWETRMAAKPTKETFISRVLHVNQEHGGELSDVIKRCSRGEALARATYEE